MAQVKQLITINKCVSVIKWKNVAPTPVIIESAMASAASFDLKKCKQIQQIQQYKNGKLSE